MTQAAGGEGSLQTALSLATGTVDSRVWDESTWDVSTSAARRPPPLVQAVTGPEARRQGLYACQVTDRLRCSGLGRGVLGAHSCTFGLLAGLEQAL
jgi:hypothetical protein